MPHCLILGFMASSLLIAANARADCEVCREAVNDADQISKQMHRLDSIVSMNEEFIASLDPADESERMKARSNVTIARKRTAALQVKFSDCQRVLGTPDCKKCFNGEKQNE